MQRVSARTYELEALYVCEHCFGPLEVGYDHSGLADAAELKRKIQAGPPSIWRYSDFLPFDRRPQTALDAGFTPLIRSERLAERLGVGEVYVKNDAANPTHSFKDRVVNVALAKAQELGYEVVACASTGNLANAVAAHAAAAGLDSYVFVPADLEEQKILATGIYGTKLVAVRRQLRRRQPPLHGAVGEHPWAFVNVNLRPYYAEGSKTLGFEVAEQLGFELPDRVVVPGRLGIAVHEDRPRLRGVARPRPPGGRAARLPRRPGRGLQPGRAGVRRRPRHLPPGAPEHDRQVARDREPGRRRVRARRRAPDRWLDRLASPTRRSSRASSCSPRRPASSPRPPAASPPRCCAKLAERGDIGPDERVVALHHRRGPEDARRRARRGLHLRRRADARRASATSVPVDGAASWPEWR